MSPLIRVILRYRAGADELRATVDSILEATRHDSYEVLVLATRESAGELAFLQEARYAARVRVVLDRANATYADSFNDVIVAAEATYCAVLEPGCLVSQEDWLDRMVAVLDAHPEVAMVQPEVFRSGVEWAGAPDQERRYVYSSCWSWPYEAPLRLALEMYRPEQTQPFEAMAGSGECCLVRAATFERLGRFDTEIRELRALTMDYCLRGWMLGAATIVDPHLCLEYRGATAEASTDLADAIHAVIKTAYKYFSPRRRDVAESSFLAHQLQDQVDRARDRVRSGRWLRERVEHERARVHDDDWLFERFEIYEEHYAKCE